MTNTDNQEREAFDERYCKGYRDGWDAALPRALPPMLELADIVGKAMRYCSTSEHAAREIAEAIAARPLLADLARMQSDMKLAAEALHGIAHDLSVPLFSREIADRALARLAAYNGEG